jgi:hypothetical protein
MFHYAVEGLIRDDEVKELEMERLNLDYLGES